MRVEPGSLESEWVRRGQATGCRRRRCCCCGDSGSRCVQAKPSLWVRQQWDQIFHFIALWATLQSLGQQLCKFCKGVKIFHSSSEIIFGQLLCTFDDFFWSRWMRERERERERASSSVNSKYACLEQIVAAKWKQQQSVVVSLAMMPPLLQWTTKIFYALKIHVEREREREREK